MEIILAAAAGLIVGALAAVLFAKGRQQALKTEAAILRSRLDDALRKAESDKEEARAHYMELMAEKERAARDAVASQEKRHSEAMEALQKRHEEAMEAQQKRFDETVRKVSAQVKSATDDMLKQRQKEFSESSNANLGQIVNPLKETIDKMKKAMDDSTLKQTEMSSAMKVTVENMMRQSEAARKSTDELTRVFRHGTKVQGDWGERVLTELFEAQGLTPGIQFDVQPVIRDASGNVVKSESGSSMRPDVILHLDDRRDVILDSKVSLSAYMDYVNAGSDEDRQKFLKAHIESMRKHVRELAAKDYSSYIRPPRVRMDYVIMFVPRTAALWAVLNAEPDFWRKAMAQNVYIADEQTLYAALRIINLTWTQIAQAQNHEKVYALAEEMMDRVGQFMKRYEALGKSLDAAVKSYEDAGKKLSPTGQSILQTCAKLEKLGARQSRTNPLPQLEEADIS